MVTLKVGVKSAKLVRTHMQSWVNWQKFSALMLHAYSLQVFNYPALGSVLLLLAVPLFRRSEILSTVTRVPAPQPIFLTPMVRLQDWWNLG
jgi:hypothetical protein